MQKYDDNLIWIYYDRKCQTYHRVTDWCHSMFGHICHSLGIHLPLKHYTYQLKSVLVLHFTCCELEVFTGSSIENMAPALGRRHWLFHWWCRFASCGGRYDPCWSSAAVSIWCHIRSFWYIHLQNCGSFYTICGSFCWMPFWCHQYVMSQNVTKGCLKDHRQRIPKKLL